LFWKNGIEPFRRILKICRNRFVLASDSRTRFARFCTQPRTAPKHSFGHFEEAQELIDGAITIEGFPIEARVATILWLEIRRRHDRKWHLVIMGKNACASALGPNFDTFDLKNM